MDYNETNCKSWIQTDWFDEWCTGIHKNRVPEENFFGKDENGDGFTLKQACNKTCDQRKLNIRHRIMRYITIIKFWYFIVVMNI